jgi:hypothetical protein
MKIGIFGDSFGDPTFPVIKNNTPSWIEILERRYDNVVSYAQPGSSLYYSIDKFKTHNRKYDKNIFLVTEPARMWAAEFDVYPPAHRFFPGLDTILDHINWQKNPMNHYDRTPAEIHHALKVLDASVIYKVYIQNIEEEIYKHNLMVNDLQKKSNIILIPCFPDSVHGTRKHCLFDIYKKENLAWGFELPDKPDISKDNRCCHMTAENNAILAEKLINSIDNNVPFSLNIDDFFTPMNKEFYINE